MATHTNLKELFTAIANAIRAKTGSTDTIVADDFPTAIEAIEVGGSSEEDYNEGYEQGKIAGNTTKYITYSWQYLFRLAAFPDGYEMIAETNDFGGSAINAFQSTTGLKKVVFKGNPENKAVTVQGIFERSTVEEIDFSGFGNGGLRVLKADGAFSRTPNLHTIKGTLDFTENTGNISCFYYAEALVNVRFTPGTLNYPVIVAQCKNLSDESVQSVIDGLKDLTGQTAVRVSFHSNVLLRLTDEQFSTITAKNWTL